MLERIRKRYVWQNWCHYMWQVISKKELNLDSEKLTMNSKWSNLAMREMESWEGSLGSSICDFEIVFCFDKNKMMCTYYISIVLAFLTQQRSNKQEKKMNWAFKCDIYSFPRFPWTEIFWGHIAGHTLVSYVTWQSHNFFQFYYWYTL